MKGLGRRRAVLYGVLVSKNRPGGVVAGFDGGYFGGFDVEASGGVEVMNERLNIWEIVGTEGFE